MDAEYNVFGKVKSGNLNAPLDEIEYKNHSFSISEAYCTIRMRSLDPGVSDFEACRLMECADVADACKFLSETLKCRVMLGRSEEWYGNANVFNGGYDYDVIEEKWITCAYDKGNLVEEKSFSK